MHSSCRVQSELGRLFGIGSGSPLRIPLSPPVSPKCPALPDGNWRRGLRSLRDLTQHLTTRADDSHAAPVLTPAEPKVPSLVPASHMSRAGKVLRVASN